MIQKTATAPPTGSQWGASVAGASGGTGLLAIINLLPEDSPLKPFLIYVSPTVAIFISIVFAYTTTSVRNWVNDRRLRLESAKARNLLQEVETDPDATEEHKKDMRKRAEKLQRTLMEVHTDRIESIRAIDST